MAAKGLRRLVMALALVCGSSAAAMVVAADAGTRVPAGASAAMQASAAGAATQMHTRVDGTLKSLLPAAVPAERFALRGIPGSVVYPPLVGMSAAITVGAATLPAVAGATAALATTERLPLVVMLHGACGQPHYSCDFWQQDGRALGWLMCPAGNVRCEDAFDWRGDGNSKAAHVDRAAEALRSRFPHRLAPAEDDILIGFSRGAFAARDIVYARPGRYRGLVLVGAKMIPDAQRLRRAGIRRVVLAAGRYDAARPRMQLAAAVLSNRGLPARFVDLGPIWHQLPADFGRVMREAVGWIRAADEPGSG